MLHRIKSNTNDAKVTSITSLTTVPLVIVTTRYCSKFSSSAVSSISSSTYDVPIIGKNSTTMMNPKRILQVQYYSSKTNGMYGLILLLLHIVMFDFHHWTNIQLLLVVRSKVQSILRMKTLTHCTIKNVPSYYNYRLDNKTSIKQYQQ
jgi:hypothetical protein